MKIDILDIEWPSEFGGLYCPACGKEVAKSESPCGHVIFVWHAMEPGVFAYISDGFSSQAESIFESIHELEELHDNDEEIDMDMLSIENHLNILESSGTNFIIKVSSSEYREGMFSDLGYFGFELTVESDQNNSTDEDEVYCG
jgi:hypothetical protein